MRGWAFPAAAGVGSRVSHFAQNHTAKGQRQEINPSPFMPKPLNHHLLVLHSPVKGRGEGILWPRLKYGLNGAHNVLHLITPTVDTFTTPSRIVIKPLNKKTSS